MTENLDTNDTNIDEDAPVADKAREPTDYERQLRREAANTRKKLADATKAHADMLAALKADHEKALAETVASVTTKAQERLIRAELKAHAVKAGIVDLDALKLLDVKAVKLSEDGEVENAEQIVTEFAKLKPHFFGQTSTSSTTKIPAQTPAINKSALEMTPEEHKQALAKLLGR